MRISVLFITILLAVNAVYCQNLIERTALGLPSDRTEEPNRIALSIQKAKGSNKSISKFELFDSEQTKNKSKGIISISIKDEIKKKFLAVGKEIVEISIPVNQDKSLGIILQRTEDFDPEMSILLGSGEQIKAQQNIIHSFRGVIDDDQNSVVSLTVWDGDIQIFIADNYGSYMITKDKAPNQYEFYKERKAKESESICGINDSNQEQLLIQDTKIYDSKGPRQKNAGDIVEVYIECDKALYDLKGGTSGTMSYLTSLFGITAALYANEGITVQLVSPKIWNVPDPYRNQAGVFNNLQFFGLTIQNNHPGRLASLISGRRINGVFVGGIAWTGVLCSNYGSSQSSGPYSYMYGMGYYGLNPFPQTSLDASILTHELGHNFGSRHTHECAWGPQGNKAIDNCSSNNCSLVQSPTPVAELGTIMSYCANIDFNKGFGTEPGNLIYTRYVNAQCLVGGDPDCTNSNKTYNQQSIPNGTEVYASNQVNILNNVSVGSNSSVSLSAENSVVVNGSFTVNSGGVIELTAADCN